MISRIRSIIIGLLALLATPYILGQQSVSISLKIGVAEFQTDTSIQRTNGIYVATLLRKYFSRFQYFTIDDPELFKQLYILQQDRIIFAKKKELAIIKEKIDKNQFIRNQTTKRKTQKELESQMAVQHALLARLQEFQVPTDDSKVSVKIGDSLVSVVKNDPEIICSNQSIDNVIFGTVKVIENMYVVTLNIYSSVTKKILYVKTLVADKNSLENAILEQAIYIAELLFNRKFCVINIVSDPANASVSVNGAEITEKPFIAAEPGSYTIVVRAPGFTTFIETVKVEPGEPFDLACSLVPLEKQDTTITSAPENAMVYINSLPVGVTPLTIALDPQHDMITIDKSDYLQMMQPANTGTTINFDLALSNGLTFNELFEKAKGRFYKSLGWFVVSLPVAALSYGSFMSIYQTEIELQTKVLTGQLSLSESQYAAQQLDGYFWVSQSAFWVSLALSTGLAINAIIQFVHYINVM